MIAVLNANKFQRLEADLPLLKGHNGPIVDFEFSPFNDNLFVTASEDGSLKLWVIPEEGYTHDTTECDADMRGHSRKLIFSKFHPSADYTLASSAADCTVRLWDISQQRCMLTYNDITTTTTALEWNLNGSMLGAISKSKQLHLFDPRKEGGCLTAATHEGTRP